MHCRDSSERKRVFISLFLFLIVHRAIKVVAVEVVQQLSAATARTLAESALNIAMKWLSQLEIHVFCIECKIHLGP